MTSHSPLPFDDYLFSNLEELENFMFENEKDLLKHFFPKMETMELFGVWFSSESVKIYYVLKGGQHVTESIKNKKMKEWLELKANIA